MGKSQIFELKSQNRKLNSLLCEIFTYLAVKVQKLEIGSRDCRLVKAPMHDDVHWE